MVSKPADEPKRRGAIASRRTPYSHLAAAGKNRPTTESDVEKTNRQFSGIELGDSCRVSARQNYRIAPNL